MNWFAIFVMPEAFLRASFRRIYRESNKNWVDKINWSSVFTLQTNGLISILWEQWCLKINNKQKQSPGNVLWKAGLENIAKFKILCINSEQYLTWNPSVPCTPNAICLLLALCFVVKKVFFGFRGYVRVTSF